MSAAKTDSNRVRVVVTGHDADGRSVVVDEKSVPPSPVAAAGTIFHVLWGADVLPRYPDDGREQTDLVGFPLPGGIRFAESVILPDAEVDYSGDSVEGIHASDGDLPGMHTTPSVDLGVVIEGDVWMVLSGGVEVHLRPGDCFVQNGTVHGWRNHTDTPSRFVVALVGTEHAALG
jgi:mannose-6-phosphate isomerase-like protein (cupin superfamily)